MTTRLISRLIQTGLAAAALSVPALAAQAADIPVKARPYIPMSTAYSWTGLYIGVSGGWATGTSKHVSDATFANVDITDPYKISGMLAGGTIGYNFQLGSFVVGVEGDWSWTNKKGTGPDIPPFAATAVSGTNEKWIATARGRAGYALPGDWLIYGTGGLAVASIEATVDFPGVANVAETKTRMGWTFGGGVEKTLMGNWSAKAEYLYVKFNSAEYFATPPVGIATRSDVPVTDHIFRVGVNYKFGGPVYSRF